jgi:parallel beta-helix repeat protein
MTVTIVALAVGGGGAFAHTTTAIQPACGATITVDTKLTADLVDCPGDGIVIGAVGITLDLGGHIVDGDGSPGLTGPNIGIRNDGYDGVTVRNGAVQEFDFGVRLDGPAANVLRHVVSTGNGRAGIRIQNSARDELSENTVVDNGTFGIIFFGGTHDNFVEKNSVSGNGGGGIGDFVSESDRIAGNVVSGNGDDGISLGDSSDVTVEENSVSDNFAGILVDGDGNTLNGNHVFGNLDGIVVDGDRNTVSTNHVADALGCDDGEGCGFGISVEGGADNVVMGNEITRTLHSGIRLDAYGAPVARNVFRNNTVRTAGVDGIAIDADDVGPVLETLLEGNHVTGASDDGIHVRSPSTTLTHNHANRNGDLGIDAVDGVTDGGGNHATGNGNAAECTIITC